MSHDDTPHDDLSPTTTEDDTALPVAQGDMTSSWGTGMGKGRTVLFDDPNAVDIYCDRNKNVNYIFHLQPLDCTIDYMEYDHDTQCITVFTTDGQKLDLGVRIQWLVRPYIARAQELLVIQTKDGKMVDGVAVNLRIKDPPITKDMLHSPDKNDTEDAEKSFADEQDDLT